MLSFGFVSYKSSLFTANASLREHGLPNLPCYQKSFIGCKSSKNFLSPFLSKIWSKFFTSPPEELFTESICNLSKYVIMLFFYYNFKRFFSLTYPQSSWKHSYHSSVFILIIIPYVNLENFSPLTHLICLFSSFSRFFFQL